MKLTTFVATSILFLVPTVAGTFLVPEVRDNGLLPRATTSITFCTGTNFGGQCNTYTPETDVCNSVPAPYVDSLFSSRASSGFVCFLYRGGDCTGCEACVDAAGWKDMASFAAVHTYKCVASDAAGCSNAFSCNHH